MKKTGLSKTEIDRMFGEMYDAVKSMANEPSDPELDNLIEDLIRKNQRRKIVEQKSPYVVKPNIRTVAESQARKKEPKKESYGSVGYELGSMFMEKAEKVFTEENAQKVLDSSKNLFKKMWTGFLNWLTVDEEPETAEPEQTPIEDNQDVTNQHKEE